MFSIPRCSAHSSEGLSRRKWLQIGGISLLGLSLSDLLQARESKPNTSQKTFGRAKNVIFLLLSGGPPQHETFDPKPDAPVEVRGQFKPISTNVSGIQFCELLPKLSAQADKLAIIRSMYTNSNLHHVSQHWVLTGRKRRLPTLGTLPTDWPNIGSVVKKLKPSKTLAGLSQVTIPEIVSGNAGDEFAGQNAGFLGPQWNSELIQCNPSASGFDLAKRFSANVDQIRLKERTALHHNLDQQFGKFDESSPIGTLDKFQQQAFDFLRSGGAGEAFALDKEPAKLRERYGMQHWGQCVLLARRLIESGVRFVTVTWPRVPGDRKLGNPLWDTHSKNFTRMKDVLAPQFDIGLSALIEDLDQRGLLDETLVVAVGEFGRTPKINTRAGRDHWGSVFSCALAGAGISGGQIYGASDKNGAYPSEKGVTPSSLAATIYHLLGIDYRGTFEDHENRPRNITDGTPLYDLLSSIK